MDEVPLGVCLDCGGPARSRRNWDAIAPQYRPIVESFHHFCGRCYVFRVLDQEQGATAIRASRRPFDCDGCGEAQPKGATARSFSRPRSYEGSLLERGRVCASCFEAWIALYTGKEVSR